MMKIIVIVLQVLAVAGGAFLGLSLKGGSEAPAHESDDGYDGGKKKSDKGKDKKKDGKKGKDKKGKDKDKKDGDGYGSGSSYMKFSRQFIVPVIKRDDVDALLILEINLELDSSTAENAYTKEPKVRDALLAALLQLSNEGAFAAKLLDEENLEIVRDKLYYAAKNVLGDAVVGVLILNVARQEI